MGASQLSFIMVLTSVHHPRTLLYASTGAVFLVVGAFVLFSSAPEGEPLPSALDWREATTQLGASTVTTRMDTNSSEPTIASVNAVLDEYVVPGCNAALPTLMDSAGLDPLTIGLSISGSAEDCVTRRRMLLSTAAQTHPDNPLGMDKPVVSS